ncbi:MAG: class III poly(R)-hydroxyalkanoic acid synthase subunit PhaC [Steroidobacteraceae bacterium]|jgi:polyhydroxyalkanoate synthase|nr:class III poly(R)-hydroxyalkanoic acid synthase subunit PhaC [Steroidobacteraceae bacterium]
MSAAPGDGRAEAWLRESAEFQRRLAAASAQLARLGPVEVGACARDAVYAEGKLVLWRYRSIAKPAGLPPLLLVYALVNRPYVLDLQPDRSLIRGLLEAGLDVWLIDWGYPDAGDRWLTLADYVTGYLERCVARVRPDGGSVNLVGVCQGGTFALAYAALEPARVANLVTMVTPVDFHTPENLLAKWVRGLDVDALVETFGNVPGEWLNAAFLQLMPFRLTLAKYLALVDAADDPAALASFLRMERWIFDSPDQAGEAFREFVVALYRDNRLVRGTWSIDGRRVDPRRLRMPILNVHATEDHLVPPSASLALRGIVGTADYTDLPVPGGHIGIYVGRRARELPGTVAGWLQERAPGRR